MKIVVRAALSFFCSVLAFTVQARAAERPFYQGKTITVLINFAAGGPTDIEGRIIARHLARHIPGQPSVIAQNMGGAGGVIAANYLGEVAKGDGLTYRLLHSLRCASRNQEAGGYHQGAKIQGRRFEL
ncbi:MAG: hypothetical protein HYV05_03655 [Deltaproteobacteria bacterium]|nr:hypothetical protein [Deltaproteobacteria bacterium]